MEVTRVRRTKETLVHYTKDRTYSKHWTGCGLVLPVIDERSTCFVELITCPKCAEYVYDKAKKVFAKTHL